MAQVSRSIEYSGRAGSRDTANAEEKEKEEKIAVELV
jgi:hypothetical protein